MKKIYAFSLIILLSSCVNTSLQPNVVSRQDAQKQQYVQEGVIVDILNVTIEGNRELGATAGALIGGAIGNKLGEGGGKSGSTAIGALIGSEIVRSDKQARADNNQFVEKEVCRIQNITYTETSEQITGYKLNVNVDGQIIEFRSNKSYNPGDTISVRKEISYFLD